MIPVGPSLIKGRVEQSVYYGYLGYVKLTYKISERVNKYSTYYAGDNYSYNAPAESVFRTAEWIGITHADWNESGRDTIRKL